MPEPVLTCLGVPLKRKALKHDNRFYSLVGVQDNLTVNVHPTAQGWAGYLQLQVPDEFYQSDLPDLKFVNLPTTHVCADDPEGVVLKLETLCQMWLVHFDQGFPSHWKRLDKR